MSKWPIINIPVSRVSKSLWVVVEENGSVKLIGKEKFRAQRESVKQDQLYKRGKITKNETDKNGG